MFQTQLLITLSKKNTLKHFVSDHSSVAVTSFLYFSQLKLSIVQNS
uniref:Uncharacterized protein n=1 Tax=Arundo donax TaxID=35708 RepID=A0A0A9DW49_ARUDO